MTVFSHPEFDNHEHLSFVCDPDFAINAGGIIDVFYERTGASPEKVRAHVEGIGRTLTEIFTRSDRSGICFTGP